MDEDTRKSLVKMNENILHLIEVIVNVNASLNDVKEDIKTLYVMVGDLSDSLAVVAKSATDLVVKQRDLKKTVDELKSFREAAKKDSKHFYT